MATGSKSQYKGSDDGDLDCDVCLVDGITSPAISYCKLCTEALCLACEKVHKASKSTRGHALLTGDQLFSIPRGDQEQPPIMTCEKHQMAIKYFCKDDNIAICSMCTKMSHESCDTIEISAHLAQIDQSKIFGTIQNKMTALEKSYEQLQKRRENGKKTLKVQIQKCLAEMKKIRKEVDGLLENLESKMVAEINRAQDEISKQIEDHLTTADATLRQIRENIATMTECQTTGQADVMFVGMTKTKSSMPEYEKMIKALEEELDDIDIQFVPDDLITTHLKNLKSLGRLDRRGKGQQDIGFSALDLTLTDPRRHDVGCANVFSAVFLPDDRVVLACGDDGLKLLDAHFLLKSHLPMLSVSVCKTSETELLVSQENAKQLQFVDVTSQMVARDVIRVGMVCNGVDYYNDEIYVVCKGDQGNLEVRVLNRNGDVIRRIGGLGTSWHSLCDVKVSSRGDKLFVSSSGQKTVTCLDQQGGVIYKYSDTDMKFPSGMYVDGHDNLLLCGSYSHNVHVITADGRKHACLVTGNDRIGYPHCISYRRRDGCLIIGKWSLDNTSSLVSFNTC